MQTIKQYELDITWRKTMIMLIVWCSLWTITQLVPNGISRSWSVPWSLWSSRQLTWVHDNCGLLRQSSWDCEIIYSVGFWDCWSREIVSNPKLVWKIGPERKYWFEERKYWLLTCSSSNRIPGDGDRLSVVPNRSFSSWGIVKNLQTFSSLGIFLESIKDRSLFWRPFLGDRR